MIQRVMEEKTIKALQVDSTVKTSFFRFSKKKKVKMKITKQTT